MSVRRTVPRADGALAAVIARACTTVGGTVVGALAVATLLLPLVARAGSAGESRVVEAAASVLSAHLRTRTEAFRIDPRPLAAGTVPPEPGTAVVVRALAAGVPVETRMRVWVDLHASTRDGGRFLRSMPVAFDVAGTRAGWIAASDLPAGVSIAHALQDGSLRQASFDIAAYPAAPVAAWTDAARLRRALRMGDALTASHLESAPIVARGDTVSLRVRDGLIGIEAKAEALQDGGRGTAVWVRVAQATAPVRARVIGVATVEVLP